ncbi:leucine-rich repeat and calponin homology domain-containing protein [Anopheles nili]|uniref:leucine-rich repeat and calponin homology domain-containing protein n=1 Tax=Anopheles nili TaxID=185578 RepID=UPI00237B8FCA|nr:leucine-rich repeat and calponin homology domain-containing protein [Anopheles nili]
MAVAACLKASQSTVLYSGQAQPIHLAGMNGVGGGGGGPGGHLQSQLTRSLERILEDAHLSGELKLSGRKLKDFPKAAGKYNLGDTVIADLSRNRFCELPEDITCLAFLERLLVYHNTIRSVPETIRGLHSLTYLDLRNNQLSVLPREICVLPLQVLLVSNNRLATLPDELGRMDKLTELDAACNQITHLPARMGDLRSLRSLNLRSNQLVYLPRDLTCLQLAFLDVSSNKIATLPVELRLMSSLVDLELSNNPLTSPPASLCVRGLVHVFKYLETIAAREEKSKSGSDGHATLRRTALSAKSSSSSLLDSQQRNRRAHVDSGYCTSDGVFEGKRWTAEEDAHNSLTLSSKWSPIPLHSSFTVMPRNGSVHNAASNPSSGGQISLAILPLEAVIDSNLDHGGGTSTGNGDVCWEEEFRKTATLPEHHADRKHLSNNNSNDISPEGDVTPDGSKTDDKSRTLSNYQTYREYKEALRQQRNLDSVYRCKDQPLTPDSAGSATESPLSNVSQYTKSISSSSVYSSSNQSSPVSPHHASGMHKLSQANVNSNVNYGSAGGHSSPLLSPNRNGAHTTVIDDGSGGSTGGTPNKRPVQKVIPSRNISSSMHNQSPTHLNGNHHSSGTASGINAANGKTSITNGGAKGPLTSLNGGTSNEYAYVKPNSPCKTTSGILTHNNVPPSSIPKPTASNGGGLGSPVSAAGCQKPLTATVGYINNAKPGQKTNKTVSWNRDVPTEKLSFTMRREFDKQKEETELIEQLRQVIETRLKMSLPEDIAPALMDGVVLCHLANHVRPRSVGSIHVPSSAVPKLTMARCRRNVDYFLDACRKIGVDEELICSCQDIVPPTMTESTLTTLEDNERNAADNGGQGSQEAGFSPRPPNPLAMYRTLAALLSIPTMVHVSSSSSSVVVGSLRRPRSPPPPPPSQSVPGIPAAATNTNSSTALEKSFNYDMPVLHAAASYPAVALQNFRIGAEIESTSVESHERSNGSSSQGSEDRRNVPVTLDLPKANTKTGKKRKFPAGRNATRRNPNINDMQSNLNEIIEECEYDSDIGKFRCKSDYTNEDSYDRSEYDDSETSLTSCDDDPNTLDNGGEAFTPTNACASSLHDTINDMQNSSNDLDTPTGNAQSLKPVEDGYVNYNIIKNNTCSISAEELKVVTKRIEFFENAAATGRKVLNSEVANVAIHSEELSCRDSIEKQQLSDEKDQQSVVVDRCRSESDHSMISTILCLGTFVFTVVYLYLYPLQYTVNSLWNLLCCAADVLEGRGVVQVAITVVELLKFHSPASNVRSPTRNAYAISNNYNSGGSSSSSSNGSSIPKSSPSSSSLSSSMSGNGT